MTWTLILSLGAVAYFLKLLGAVIMIGWRVASNPPFFSRKPEVAKPGFLDGVPGTANATTDTEA